jgi:Mg/Co/Ni transporter MgtE
MSNNISNKVNDALFNFYLEADKDTISEILKEEIENPDEYSKKKKQLLFYLKATANKKRNDYLLSLAEKFMQGIEQNIEKPVAILKQIIQGNSSLALYRNLDKLSKEDIIEIIKDKNFVELIEQLDKNENNL